MERIILELIMSRLSVRQIIRNFGLLRWLNTVFLYLCVIHRYFQTTTNWAAKIGKMQVQLKKEYILIRFILLIRFKPALKTGFDLFSENPVVRFFLSLFSRNLRKILAYWHCSQEILTERSPIIWCFAFKRFLNMSSVRFQFLFAGEIRVFCTIILPNFTKL